ncbi:MAG: cation:proton antiporter [Bacilli bacterium]|jgi:Kef-type K+ transport system membrane component KefB|nr:cation:proton antiporter [Bacilli bacterium]
MNFLSVLSSTVTAGNEPFDILLPIGLILLLSKTLALVFSKIHLPQVIGYLVAGLLVGLIFFIPNQTILTTFTINGINDLAKIGVVLILFTAGLETDLQKIKAVGFASVVITSLGVLVPLGLGFLVAWSFMPTNSVYENLYYGVILSATSVSITVATLKELHKLDTPVGSAIVSAAILDDIIGIVLLSLVISLSGGDAGTKYVENEGLNILLIVLVMIGFFAVSAVLGFFIRKLFDWMGKKWPHHIRIPIFSLAFCFLWAYCAEKFFNIADITGAYVAGLILSATNSKHYIDHRADTTANLLFTPIFFASIALKMYTSNLDFSDLNFLWFGICWIFVGAIGKVIGAGSGALMCKFNFKDSLRIGLGMMARAEVLIVCAQKGVDANLVSLKIMPFTLCLIILTSFITPILLKFAYKGELEDSTALTNGSPSPVPAVSGATPNPEVTTSDKDKVEK